MICLFSAACQQLFKKSLLNQIRLFFWNKIANKLVFVLFYPKLISVVHLLNIFMFIWFNQFGKFHRLYDDLIFCGSQYKNLRRSGDSIFTHEKKELFNAQHASLIFGNLKYLLFWGVWQNKISVGLYEGSTVKDLSRDSFLRKTKK